MKTKSFLSRVKSWFSGPCGPCGVPGIPGPQGPPGPVGPSSTGPCGWPKYSFEPDSPEALALKADLILWNMALHSALTDVRHRLDILRGLCETRRKQLLAKDDEITSLLDANEKLKFELGAAQAKLENSSRYES